MVWKLSQALAALLALTMGGNGLVMLLAGRWWYGAVPGVTMTGAFNPHFVKDIGAAYLVAGLAFAWRASRPTAAAAGAACAAALFLGLHAAIHVADALGDPMGAAHLARDFPTVILPALIAGWIVLQQRSEMRHAAMAA